MLSAIQMGISLSEYDLMTPYELNLFAEVYMDKIEAEKEEKISLVWLGEYYHRIKKLPSLKEALGKKQSFKHMTDQQMFEMVKKLNQKLGGKTV